MKKNSIVSFLAFVVVGGLALQLFFILKIALMVVIDPQSTAFQRSEAYRITAENTGSEWRQKWLDYDDISVHMKRAVIASEDDEFSTHDGVQWDAITSAWERNAKAKEKAERRAAKVKNPENVPKPKIFGGSTITQQLAKNLFLSGERNLFRKAQELVLTMVLEVFLSKKRILEIYLNNVEWGEGIFGVEAAAQTYFKKSAANLTPAEAARLAVMLPRPKFFEKNNLRYTPNAIKSAGEKLYEYQKSKIEEIFQYLYNLGAEPRIYKMDYKYEPKYTRDGMVKKDHLIYFKDYNLDVNSFIINRSYMISDKNLKDLVIDKELEEGMKLFLATNKYNV